MLFWTELLNCNDDVGGGCEQEQTTRLKNHEAPSSQRQCSVHGEPEGLFKALQLCTVTIESYGGAKGWQWWLHSSKSIAGACTQIKYLCALMTLLGLLKAIKHATNPGVQSWVTLKKYSTYCTSKRAHTHVYGGSCTVWGRQKTAPNYTVNREREDENVHVCGGTRGVVLCAEGRR